MDREGTKWKVSSIHITLGATYVSIIYTTVLNGSLAGLLPRELHRRSWSTCVELLRAAPRPYREKGSGSSNFGCGGALAAWGVRCGSATRARVEAASNYHRVQP